MNRRNLLKTSFSMAVLATSSSTAFGQRKSRYITDCGPPESELCRMEWKIRQRQRRLALERERKQKARIAVWNKRNNAEAARLAKKHGYDNYRVKQRGGKRIKAISGGHFDSNYSEYRLNVRVFPLPDINGRKAKTATFSVWRKTGWGNTKNVATLVTRARIKAKARRSYRIGEFSTTCVIMWDKYQIEDNPNDGLPPGCYPANSKSCNPNITDP